MNRKEFPMDGSPLTTIAGGYQISLIPTVDGGFTLRVKHACGTYEVAELTQQFRDERMARSVARTLAAGLKADISIHQFVQDRLNAQQAVTDADRLIRAAYDAVDAGEVAARLNADVDARHAVKVKADRELAADVAEIVGDGQGWNRYRQTYRPVRPTKTRVYLKPLNATEKRALRLHQGGVIRAGGGISWLTLRNLGEKGYGTAHTLPGRPKVTHIVLNQAGLEAADAGQVAA